MRNYKVYRTFTRTYEEFAVVHAESKAHALQQVNADPFEFEWKTVVDDQEPNWDYSVVNDDEYGPE